MAERYFNHFKPGDRIEHDIRRTVTETDNLLFTTMTHNPQPLHLDAEAARKRVRPDPCQRDLHLRFDDRTISGGHDPPDAHCKSRL